MEIRYQNFEKSTRTEMCTPVWSKQSSQVFVFDSASFIDTLLTFTVDANLLLAEVTTIKTLYNTSKIILHCILLYKSFKKHNSNKRYILMKSIFYGMYQYLYAEPFFEKCYDMI
jgi:hypothetical protein